MGWQQASRPERRRRLLPTPGGLDEDHPDWEALTERQLALYGASISLHDKGLVRVVSPANGARPDLVETTAEGRAALPT
ncbi:hypothetical protein [Streptomyces coacervatus]|uniref:hypothetical protein n=1 Tax=Streptomyces coacervatus TaxID=647381 RepID=UPI0031EE5D4F